MTISPIDPVLASQSLTVARSQEKVTPGNESFASHILNAVDRVDAHIKAAETDAAAFAVGGAIPPHQVMLAMEDARMEFMWMLQVRSKLVEGFQELMRMQL